MKYSAFHLNLLKETEKLSSSPIRVRVMLPLLTLLACAGMAIWWGMMFTQTMVVKTQAQAIEDDINAKTKDHAEIILKQNLVRELTLQLEQLGYYKSGVRHVGSALAELAEVMPLKIQLTELRIQPPAPQILQTKGSKTPAFGPPDNVETQKLVIVGRTTRETPVMAMMESFEAPEFATLMTKARKINSFKQDSATANNKRLLSFEVEYVMPERKFAK